MQTASHYDVLKVSRDAPDEVIRAAYKTLSQKYHPDRNQGNKEAAEIMIRLNVAFGVLSDPIKRRQYDAELASNWNKQPNYSQHSSQATPPRQPAYEAKQSSSGSPSSDSGGEQGYGLIIGLGLICLSGWIFGEMRETLPPGAGPSYLIGYFLPALVIMLAGLLILYFKRRELKTSIGYGFLMGFMPTIDKPQYGKSKVDKVRAERRFIKRRPILTMLSIFLLSFPVFYLMAMGITPGIHSANTSVAAGASVFVCALSATFLNILAPTLTYKMITTFWVVLLAWTILADKYNGSVPLLFYLFMFSLILLPTWLNHKDRGVKSFDQSG